jgi:hypothetical protein
MNDANSKTMVVITGSAKMASSITFCQRFTIGRLTTEEDVNRVLAVLQRSRIAIAYSRILCRVT